MSRYSLAHLEDDVLVRRLAELAACDRKTTAQLLAHLTEVEARQIHLRAGYDSMKAYCVAVLHFSDEAARMRVYAAHVARDYPALFEAVADGRLHLTAVTMLASRLTVANVDELIEVATHKTRAELELEMARRFPQAEALRLDDGVTPQVVVPQAPDAVGRGLNRVQTPTPEVVEPISEDRFRIDISIDKQAHENLRKVQALLGHSIPQGNVEPVIARALEIALAELEKRKFAKVEKPRKPGKLPKGPRAIASHVKLAVYKRDGGRCAYISPEGHRCGSTVRIEFDHIVPVAQGGASTANNIRLLCRAHNQFMADQVFGETFMDEQRAKSELREDVAAGLRSLGMKVTDARKAAAQVPIEAGMTIEEALKAALRMLSPKTAQARPAPPLRTTAEPLAASFSGIAP